MGRYFNYAENLHKRSLGADRLEVSELGFGCMGLSFGYGPAVEKPGTTKLHRLEENLGAAAIHLTAAELRNIDPAATAITVHGHRYPEYLDRLTGR